MKYLVPIIVLALTSCQKSITKETVVGIQAYKGFPMDKAKSISKMIDSFYNVRTVIVPEKELYANAFTNVKSPRYRADSIIKIQQRKLPDSIDFIIGLTSKDISTTKRNADGEVLQPSWKYQDWGVMGLGYCPGKSCVISTFRLKHKDFKKQLGRLKKVAVHEFGHNLGLPHCKNKNCVMTDAVESIATIDKESLSLCKDCRSKI